MSSQTDASPWTPQLLRVMAGLMLSLFVAAMDATVVGTALPTIARELGSFELHPWMVSGYLITATPRCPSGAAWLISAAVVGCAVNRARQLNSTPSARCQGRMAQARGASRSASRTSSGWPSLRLD